MLRRTKTVEIENLEVLRCHSRYTVSGQVRLQSPLEAVRAQLLNFNHMDRLHRCIQRSELQYRFPDGRHRVHVQVRFCIIRFEFALQSTQDFTWNEYTIQAVMLPEKGDFTYGKIWWNLAPDDSEGTQLQFRVELIPAFWVPPLIGPYLLKHLLLEKAREITQNLERLATLS
ncbi:hypothetical protein [Nitrosococcus watsonii]|uniref:Ribosome association toxin RatA n=1 Tax=Nitrosococcus watsoni (strain C-113) TaxID=105559 RepID=D8K7Q4_NITWC|nr:hypothetical protein [Nitrosococcus watsonii]ADJ28931.1 conserved hypothetical protein [Nitrosococcus watsonii C-113]